MAEWRMSLKSRAVGLFLSLLLRHNFGKLTPLAVIGKVVYAFGTLAGHFGAFAWLERAVIFDAVILKVAFRCCMSNVLAVFAQRSKMGFIILIGSGPSNSCATLILRPSSFCSL